MLQIDIQNSIARVTLDRADVHNAFNEELIARLNAAFSDLGARSDVRAIVLRGNGKSFSAGADMNWMQRTAGYTRDENLRDARAAAQMFLTLARCSKPVIARVHGAALGGGSGLVAACDIAVAVESAQFGFTEVKLGIIPAVISPFVIARIGAANAREYFLTGERIPASTARQIGLVQHVAPDETSMDALIESKLAQFMTSSPTAIATAKELIFGVAGRPIDSLVEYTAQAIAAARASDEGRAGIAAFLSRSKPPWNPS
jgi:methylglutaconyl-CoA hydratase